MKEKRVVFISGGLGFIGSELAKKLYKETDDTIIIYDNLSNGSLSSIPDEVLAGNRIKLYIDDIKDLKKLTSAMVGADIVYHFASNADIAKSSTDPTIDFYEGTLLTQNVLEAMRINGVKKIVYASGSGVYGNTEQKIVREDYSPMLPISPYGASKLAGEGLISAYCYMFGMRGYIYRFANVVGGGMTHGVILDFVRKLALDGNKLEILGDGNQLKGYAHVSDILDGIQTTFEYVERAHQSWENVIRHNALCTAGVPSDYLLEKECVYTFNLAPDTQITVNEIAKMIEEKMGLKGVVHICKQGNIDGRGWQGDVPVIKMDSSVAKRYGWQQRYTSKGAVEKAIEEVIKIELDK